MSAAAELRESHAGVHVAGFSMIEMLIVLAIIAILGTIAYPSYKDKVYSGRRSDARTALSDLATRLESYYAKTNTYATATIGTGNATDVLPAALTSQGYYTLAIDAANTTATTYSITATPTGVQAGDTRCLTLIINSLNVRTVKGTAPATSCW